MVLKRFSILTVVVDIGTYKDSKIVEKIV
jgi:hypothetical protein